mmetsp:Transcript_1883/g.5099  ORF Transcript_1883/g.5099 Transcript_1883/m.5099 type:complete len:106 (-) Transcript_1883:15-332(-)
MVAGGSGVVLRDGMNAQWHIFVEVASFEYEWVACMPHDWVPSEEAWREAVHPRKKVFFSGFFREAQHGHSGGYWPYSPVAMPLRFNVARKLSFHRTSKSEKRRLQ